MEVTTGSKLGAAKQLGIIFGIIMVLEMVIMYVANINPVATPSAGVIMNTFNYLILPVALIVMACKSYKKNNEGFISFGECIKTGVLLCVIAAVIAAVGMVVFNIAFPEYQQEVLDMTRTAILEQNPEMPEEQLEMAMSMSEKFMQPAFAIPITILMYAFIGLIYSLIIGAIVKRDRPQEF